MASNQLSDATCKKIKETIDQLFGRVLSGVPCPLTMDQMRDVSWCLFSDEDRRCIQHLTGTYGREHFKTVRQVRYTIIHPSYPEPLKLRMSNVPGDWFWSPYANEKTMGPEQWTSCLARPLIHEFLEWMTTARELNIELTSGITTLNNILAMASTPGQLMRMLPELRNYLSPKERGMSSAARRSSAMPYEWAAYDKARVNQLSISMAKCKMLPEPLHSGTQSPIKWSERENFTWVN